MILLNGTHHFFFKLFRFSQSSNYSTVTKRLNFFFQNWCGTDRIVLIKTIRMLFKKLFEDQGGSPDLVGNKQMVSIANNRWEAECIDYIVSILLDIYKKESTST